MSTKPEFLKLNENGSIVSLEGVLAVYVLDENGGNYNYRREIKIRYRDEKTMAFSYGYDDRHKNENAIRRDVDFKQIEDALTSPPPPNQLNNNGNNIPNI